MNGRMMVLALVTAGLAAACAPSTTAGQAASASLVDASGRSVGTARFTGTAGGGVRLLLNVSGLPAGQHGTHVHANGSCGDTTDGSGATVKFGGAGGHFDPMNTQKHGSPANGSLEAHAGDLPNLSVAADGSGTLDFTTSKFSMAGSNGVIGRAIVIHAAADDFASQPAGNSGGRISCGVITGA
jgi:Cu-Zn family superoxide dismutase